ncbi:MAG: hydantoinase/oxoprolinase family protein [Actinobacteria bacterium]|nr:MAG: hydantoinase/oxoprolinase family protein [Actinomycetota bacterium]
MADWRLAVDIGGTFTDSVLLDAASGRVAVDKTLTTPGDLLVGFRRVVDGVLARAGAEPTDVHAPIVHATTLITNALIEGKTAPTAFVTTQGFADVLLIRDEHRYDMYDLQIEFPEPPVPRERTFEIDERTLASGEVLTPPSDADLDRLAAAIAAADVRAVAVSLLHSYANPANERAVRDGLAQRLLGMPISVSSDLVPQMREYPRAVTTVCNAATVPLIGPYLDALERWLHERGFGGGLMVMLSNGGVVSPAAAAQAPIRLVESGPAAGALAGTWYANSLGEPRLLCFDMGGTTAKSCLIERFEPDMTMEFEVARVYRFKKGSGLPVTVPSVDLVEIGAGGGSLAHVDDLGLLKVGPESAGAEPGPACYGQGGTGATVTDADLEQAFLDPNYFLGGEMPLDVEAGREALGKVASDIAETVPDTAAGIYEVVNQNMASGARMHAIERGVDLRGVPVLAFGGAGPVHACRVAELLESARVVFPARASVLSAFGALVSPVRIDLARTLVRELAEVDENERDALLAEMSAEGERILTDAGVPPSEVRYRFGIDARYRGQAHEITIWVGDGPDWPSTLGQTLEQFSTEYARVYGLSIPDVPVQVVTWRVAAWAPAPVVELPPLPAGTETPEPIASRPVRFERGADVTPTPVFARNDLGAGARIAGPALIQERETTVVLRPGWDAEVATDGSVVATRRAS